MMLMEAQMAMVIAVVMVVGLAMVIAEPAAAEPTLAMAVLPGSLPSAFGDVCYTQLSFRTFSGIDGNETNSRDVLPARDRLDLSCH